MDDAKFEKSRFNEQFDKPLLDQSANKMLQEDQIQFKKISPKPSKAPRKEGSDRLEWMMPFEFPI